GRALAAGAGARPAHDRVLRDRRARAQAGPRPVPGRARGRDGARRAAGGRAPGAARALPPRRALGVDQRGRADRGLRRPRGLAPGLEVEPGSITLGEIQRRAAAFDPLTLRVDPEVAAISANAWSSLGSRGLALHVERRPGRVTEYLVLARGAGRADRYHVLVD